jgi:uncharacterized membrane protein
VLAEVVEALRLRATNRVVRVVWVFQALYQAHWLITARVVAVAVTRVV